MYEYLLNDDFKWQNKSRPFGAAFVWKGEILKSQMQCDENKTELMQNSLNKNNKCINACQKAKTSSVEIQPMKTPIEPALMSTGLISPFRMILS